MKDKKIGGILCRGELYHDYKLEMGIGININAEEKEYSKVPDASSIFVETGKQIDAIEFFWRLSEKLVANLSEL